MAIQIKQVSKRKNGAFSVTAEDTLDQIGTDEKGNPVYQTYSVIYNPHEGLAGAKKRLVNQIKAHKAEKNECDTLKANIQTATSTIDTSKI